MFLPTDAPLTSQTGTLTGTQPVGGSEARFLNRLLHNKIGENKELTKADLVDIAREFGVSTPALAYRMKNIKLISWEVANQIAHDDEILRLSRDRRWKEKEKPKSELLTELALKGLRKSIISRGKFAELCGIQTATVSKVERGDLGVKLATLQKYLNLLNLKLELQEVEIA